MLMMGFCRVCQHKAGALFQTEESTALKMTSIVIKETSKGCCNDFIKEIIC